MINCQQLVGMQRAEFAKAARLQACLLRVRVAITAAAGVAVFISGAIAVYIAAIIAVGLALLWAWLNLKFRESRSQAERARRTTLLLEGLGNEISKSELCDLEAHFTVSSKDGSKYEDPNYYAALASPGDERLAEILEENTFLSEDLMRRSARRTWIEFAFYLVVALALLFVSVPFVAMDQFAGSVRVVCAVLTLLVSTEVIGAALAYGRAARALGRMLPRLEAVRARQFWRPDLLLLLLDYNAAVEGAPMFRPNLYKKRRSQLNELWKRHRSGRGI